MRRVAGEALTEIEREIPFQPDEPEALAIPRAPATGTWQAVEPGLEGPRPQPVVRDAPGPALMPSLAPPAAEPPRAAYVPLAAPPASANLPASAARPPAVAPRPPARHGARRAPRLPAGPARSRSTLRAWCWSRSRAASRRGSRRSGRSRTRSGSRAPCSTGGRAGGRWRSRSAGLVAAGRDAGKVELSLGPTVGHRLWPIALEDEPLYLREEALSGFEAAVVYENGRLPVGDGDFIPMVQLRGPGTVVASVPQRGRRAGGDRGPEHGAAGARGAGVDRAGGAARAPAERGARRASRLRGVRGRGDGAPRWPLIGSRGQQPSR